MKALDFFVDRPLPIFLAAGLVSIAGAWCMFELPPKPVVSPVGTTPPPPKHQNSLSWISRSNCESGPSST